jgi:hypothetical protein
MREDDEEGIEQALTRIGWWQILVPLVVGLLAIATIVTLVVTGG